MSGERTHRRLAAIVAADVVGFSRLMEADEVGTLAALKEIRNDIVDPLVASHDGRIVKLMGDGTLVEFTSVVEAVQCATSIQGKLCEYNASLPSERQLHFRIGINLGDVIVDGDDIYGDGVNVAARLEGLAEPGGVCVSGSVQDAAANKLALQYEFLGEQAVRNVEKPVRVYRVSGPGSPAAPRVQENVHGSPIRQRTKPSLAIKPFANVSVDPEQDHFADGLTNGITIALVKVSALVLVTDESPKMHKTKQLTVQELGRQFDVQYVLKGGVGKHGDRIRVNAELIELSTGRYLWAEHFDRELRDIGDLFSIQDEITDEIVTALDVELLSGEAARMVRKELGKSRALECMYRGEEVLFNATTALEIREAQRLFEETIRLEPESSVGYACTALAYWEGAISGLDAQTASALERAAELSNKALSLGDTTGYPHLILAHIYLTKRAYEQAVEQANLAVLLRPSCPGAYSLKASVLTYLGRPLEAIDVARYAQRLTPVQPPICPAALAAAYHDTGRHEDAVAAARAVIDVDDGAVDPYVILAASNVALGKIEDARWAAERTLKLKPEFCISKFADSQPYKDPTRLDRLKDELQGAGFS